MHGQASTIFCFLLFIFYEIASCNILVFDAPSHITAVQITAPPTLLFLLITLNSLAWAFSLASLCTWPGSGSAKLPYLLFHKTLSTGGAFISFTIGLPTNPNFWCVLITIPTVPSVLIGWTHFPLQISSTWWGLLVFDHNYNGPRHMYPQTLENITVNKSGIWLNSVSRVLDHILPISIVCK